MASMLSIVVILYFIGCFLFIRTGDKKEMNNKKILEQLRNENPDYVFEDRRTFSFDRTDYVINRSDKVRSIINIVIYFVFFFLLVNVISQVAILVYCNSNGITLNQINANDPAFNKEIYDEMAGILNVALELIVYGSTFIILSIISFNYIKEDLKRFTKKDVKSSFIGLGFIYLGSLAGTILLAALGVTDESTNEAAINEIMKSSFMNGAIMSVITVVLAPVVEELIFRKSIFNVVGNNNRLAIIISSVVFGFLHVVSPCSNVIDLMIIGKATYLDLIKEFIYIIPYSFMGAAIGYVYIRSNRNVVATILAHMMNNLISTVVTLLM